MLLVASKRPSESESMSMKERMKKGEVMRALRDQRFLLFGIRSFIFPISYIWIYCNFCSSSWPYESRRDQKDRLAFTFPLKQSRCFFLRSMRSFLISLLTKKAQRKASWLDEMQTWLDPFMWTWHFLSLAIFWLRHGKFQIASIIFRRLRSVMTQSLAPSWRSTFPWD